MALNAGYTYREIVSVPSGRSALEHLVQKYRHSTEVEWAERFARGEVELDGRVARGDEPLRAGQVLAWHRPAWDEPDVPQVHSVVYEDAHLLAVVKPSGLPTLPSGGYLVNTLLHRVQATWPEATPLHRLGRATSGLQLFARTQAAAAALSRDWREGRVQKRYRALSDGRAGRDAFVIDAPIGLVPHPRLGSVHGANPLGKPARSLARVLERRAEQTLFEVDIETGRPEQIRIHLACIGHPLSGDPLFAAGGLPRARAPGLPGDGGYLLHAAFLAFQHPASGAPLRLHAPPPDLLRAAHDEPRPPDGRCAT